ncbi:run domain Beclin-1-interacting and cysteine-rich domain-containing protein [Scaptodrosophila lebanonensis]|uniref:Run domain Beclin-1-interacting and cysteine-rich domain-containing protein n=1 Tax=Drosophila lebanonensis TaxID=7225 RepID=A0A6J2TZT5_DROLE|nr:run domain Beclin-1-interacting and cysteine-rich domain-containing protein [Scaptodrosophila lebanonensis]
MAKSSALLSELRGAVTYWFQSKRTPARTTTTTKTTAYQDDDNDVNVDDDDDEFQLLTQSICNILEHGFKQSALVGDALQRLIDDFEFLRVTEQMQHHRHHQQHLGDALHLTSRSAGDFLREWVTRCLHSRCLSQCLQSLVADKELLDCYYQRSVAFLCQSRYATALFVCLTAIQLNQYSLLSQLDTQLLTQQLQHRRTSSQPNFSISPRLHVVREEEGDEAKRKRALKSRRLQRPVAKFRRVKSLPQLDTHMLSSGQGWRGNRASQGSRTERQEEEAKRRRQTYSSPCARWLSPGADDRIAPNDLLPSTSACSRRSQLSSDSSQLSSSNDGYKSHTSSSNSSGSGSGSSITMTPTPPRIQLINCDEIEIWTDQGAAATPTTTTPTEIPQADKGRRPHAAKRGSPLNNFLTNLFGSPPIYTSWYRTGVGCDAKSMEVVNCAESVLDTFLPVNGKKLRTRRTQSLFEDAAVSMLDYTTPAAAAEMAALPPTTSSRPLDIVASSVGDGADVVGAGSNTTANSTSWSLSSESNSKLDNQSLAAFLQMSRYTHNNTDLEKENAHFRISEACITAIEHVKWTRQDARRTLPPNEASNAVMQSETLAQLPYAEQVNASDAIESHTAEAVGLQLISKFNDQQLPKLSELKWLVSEEDAPQQLLPMPKSPATDQQSGMTRGTKTWAPPRQQIIFTEHPAASRSELLTRQNYRCAGCGMRVSKQFVHHFRYCSYLGKYMCTGCHRQQISAIPAKILQAWDFRCYPVSVFAYRLIEQMYAFPLFHVPDLNAQLYGKHKALAIARRRRVQLQFIKEFIRACRFAVKEQSFFDAIPPHITNEPDIWSMSDFVDVQNNSMTRSIEELIALSEQHVQNCVLCTGRAFVCEYCDNAKLLYPWQRKVQRCLQCGACAHQSCWRARRESCQRCQRLNSRQQLEAAKSKS